jgi:hypothetical protein
MTYKKTVSPQYQLRKALKSGNLKRAEKAFQDGALVQYDAQTDAERLLVDMERKDLWNTAIAAPTSACIRWLVEKDPSFATGLFADTVCLTEVMKEGKPDTLAWARACLLPQLTAHAPLDLETLRTWWDNAIARADEAGVAWLLEERLMPHKISPEDAPALWQTLSQTSTWQLDPLRLVPKLTLLAAHGHTAASADYLYSPLDAWIERYKIWFTHPQKTPTQAAYEKAGPLIWDILVGAGADPTQPDASGQPMWKAIEQTPLGQRYMAQVRQEEGHTQAPDTPSRRRRLRA